MTVTVSGGKLVSPLFLRGDWLLYWPVSTVRKIFNSRFERVSLRTYYMINRVLYRNKPSEKKYSNKWRGGWSEAARSASVLLLKVCTHLEREEENYCCSYMYCVNEPEENEEQRHKVKQSVLETEFYQLFVKWCFVSVCCH